MVTSTHSPGSLIARGRTAEVYAWRERQVLKLFYAWCPPHWAEIEIQAGRIAAATDLPTPRLIDVLEIEGRQGIVFERVQGASMLQRSREKPWLILRFARLLAELQAEIHKNKGDGLPHLRSYFQASIAQAETLPSAQRLRVLRLLDTLPEEDALCHFDFHPDQVMITDAGPLIIDWMTAHRGHPLADIARTSVLLKIGQTPYAGWAERTLINLWRGLFYRTYMARCLELNPSATRSQVRAWMVPVAAARLSERIPGEEKPLLRMIQKKV